MPAHELHGELFEGIGAFDLGIRRIDDTTIGLSVVRSDSVEAVRVHLPTPVARQAWVHLGELLGMNEQVQARARELAREWIRMDDNDRAELHRLREELARERGTQLG